MLLPHHGHSLRSQTRLLGFVAFYFCWVTFAANAQHDAPVHSIDGQYIGEWLILGPFPSADLEEDFLASVGGEAHVNPKPGDTVTTADGKMLTWTLFRSGGKLVDPMPLLATIRIQPPTPFATSKARR